MKTDWRAWGRAALAALGLSTLVAGGGLREDEIDCEAAVSHLQECCPGFEWASTLACEYSGGCGYSVDPALSLEESTCIRALRCDEIVARGICERTVNLESPSIDSWDGTSTTHAMVCP